MFQVRMVACIRVSVRAVRLCLCSLARTRVYVGAWGDAGLWADDRRSANNAIGTILKLLTIFLGPEPKHKDALQAVHTLYSWLDHGVVNVIGKALQAGPNTRFAARGSEIKLNGE